MIRQYNSGDVDRVVSIWQAASALAHSFLSQKFLALEAENVRHVYPVYAKIWVKELAGKVVGFVAMNGNEIGGLFLDPACHRQGIGREMVDFMVDKMGSVTVEVFEANAIGRGFYDGYGFRQTGQYLHESSGHMTLQMVYQPGDA